jgi:hypothetical protein
MGCGSSILSSIRSTLEVNPVSDCSKSPESIISATNTIVSLAITQTINNCFISQVAEQSVRIKCKPNIDPNLTCYEENATCANCIDNILQSQIYQNNLERALWSSSPASVRLPINTMYQNLFGQMEACGLTYCKACVLNDVTQINLIQSTAECIESSMTTTNITNNLNTLIQQQLLQNQDVLSGASQTLGIPDLQKLSETISNNIMTVVNNKFITDLRANLSTTQAIELISDTSITLGNISQSTILTQTEKFVSSNQVALSAFTQETFQSISDIAQSQNTLNEVGQLVIQSSLSFLDSLNSAVSMVTLSIIVLLSVVVLGIIGFLMYGAIKKEVEKRTETELKKEEITIY